MACDSNKEIPNAFVKLRTMLKGEGRRKNRKR